MASDPIGTVRFERHDDGHSVWVRIDDPITEGAEWTCISSTAPGNVGCTMGTSLTGWAEVIGAVPGTPAADSAERAVPSAVASAHLSGVDLPADWVETLGKVARGEVTADDAVQVVKDSHLRDQIAANLARHLYWHPGRCECGWKVNETGDVDWQAQFRAHVVQSIVDEAVAPLLAAKDEALDDVERLRSALSKALADLVVRRQALANVLGVTDAAGVSGYYRMIQDVADLRAELEAVRARAQLAEDERDKANRQNESLARRLHLRFQNEQKLSAELDAVKASYQEKVNDFARETLRVSAMLERCDPKNVPIQVVGEAGLGWEDAQRHIKAAIAVADAQWAGQQPDTEATEQAPRCGEAGHDREFCDEPVPDGFCSEHGEVGSSAGGGA